MEFNKDLIDLFISDKDLVSFDNGETLKADSLETLALYTVASFSKRKKNLAIVLPSLFDANTFISFLSQFLSKEDVLFYPYDEVLRIEAISSSKEMVKERLYTLSQLVSSTSKHIFVTNANGLIHQVSPYQRLKGSLLEIKKGDTISPEDLSKWLVELGYTRVNKVEEVFEFSSRGEIFDIFTPSNEDPYRIEYFDDEVEEIRIFSSKDELSFKKADSIKIIPAHENLFTSKEIEEGISRIKASLKEAVKDCPAYTEELSDRTNRFISEVENSGIDENKVRYLPFFTSTNNSVLEYLSDYRILFYRAPDIESSANSYYMEAVKYFEELQNAHLALKEEMNCFKLEDVISSSKTEYILDEESDLSVTDIPYHFISVMDVPKMLDSFDKDGYKIRVFMDENKFARYKESMSKSEYNFSKLKDYKEYIGKDLTRGFLIPHFNTLVLSSREIFGLPEGSSYFLKRFKEAKVINKYQDLTPGDYVVHEEQGIGRYLGIKEIDGLEYLDIQYEGDNAHLYVPLDKYKLIRKYSSKEGLKPRLDKLGGASWAKRKAKIRGRVAYLADRLIEIAAMRNQEVGYSFQKDDELEDMFDSSFPYQLTLAQQRAWGEIKADMMSSHPMDRLLAGDVGFGKTEVAFRAAFKAMLSGKQAALLCPTTVLCQQHYEVAINRFAGFDVKIAMISRNVTPAEQKKIILGLKTGDINFVIGTHRLLSDDVVFKDIGLLIVDEEQRFGVVHKEKIKERFSKIDVLTLTATPIPRTLQMSLLNVRQLSLLDDPPINRLPIKTYVVRYNKDLVKEVIARELGRQGQIYYLHNRVQTIYKKAKELQEMFPNCVVGVAHGQMLAEQLSDTMTDFYAGKIDILVCTTIIETGLDVPNCNTIIVERAEDFGLAQLYQIKGRVGRSSRLAYAYLTYPDYMNLDEDARKRLKALKDFTELGSGFKIANEDLNIRGAGDILGKEQAGFIDSIGYDAYMSLLHEVMGEKTLQGKAKPSKKGTKYELSFSLDSHIPSTYASETDRINIYRELYDISSIEELSKYESKVKDVYGHFPMEMNNLFTKKEIEIMLDDPSFENFKEYMDHYLIKMSRAYSCTKGVGTRLMSYFMKMDFKKVDPHFYMNTIDISLYKTSDYLLDLYDLIKTILKAKE